MKAKALGVARCEEPTLEEAWTGLKSDSLMVFCALVLLIVYILL